MGEAEQKSGAWEPKVVAFVCSWCSGLSADLAGTGGEEYPSNVRVVRVPCAGRINPLFVAKAFQTGADGVVIYGCHPGDCHYHTGNLSARRRMALFKRFMAYIGTAPERIQVSWISGAEGPRFAEIARKAVEDVRALGPVKGLVKETVS